MMGNFVTFAMYACAHTYKWLTTFENEALVILCTDVIETNFGLYLCQFFKKRCDDAMLSLI